MSTTTSFYGQQWTAKGIIAAADGDTDLVAAPGAGKKLWVQKLVVNVTVANAATFRIEDKGSSPTVFFSGTTNLAVGMYEMDFGPIGIAASEANVAIEFDCSAAGVAASISLYGRVTE